MYEKKLEASARIKDFKIRDTSTDKKELGTQIKN